MKIAEIHLVATWRGLGAFVRTLRPSDARNRLPVMAARALGECGRSRVVWGRPGGSRTTLMCYKVL